MEKIKDPAMILSIINTVGMVGGFGYFYKQLSDDRQTMQKIGATLSGVVRKLTDIEKGEQNRGEALQTLNDEVKRLNHSIADLPTFDTFENLDFDLDDIVAILNDNNINIERASQAPKRHPEKKRHTRRNDDDEETEREEKRESRREVRRQPASRAREDTSNARLARPAASSRASDNYRGNQKPDNSDDKSLIDEFRTARTQQ